MAMEPRELRRAAVQSARRAREMLARVVALSEDARDEVVAGLPETLSQTVGLLFAAETGKVEGVRTALADAMTQLGSTLSRLSAVAEPSAATLEAMEGIAGTLSLLHPARAELERALRAAEQQRTEAEPVIPLSRRRSPPDPDRRRAPRVEVEADIGFHSESNFYSGFSGDLSDGGIFVATYDLLPVGSSLSVSFVLPGGHPVTAKGRVSWVREPLPDSDAHPGMGVVFDGLAPEDQSAVMEFIAHRSPLFHEG